MKCTHCNQREANTHIKRIINGKREEMHLCSECAEELGVMNDFNFEPFSMNSFFGNLLGAGASALNSLAGIDRCTYCGSSFNDVVNSGQVGCAHCYDKFDEMLSPSIEKLHGRAKHIGKSVTYTEEKEDERSAENEKEPSKLEALKADLKKAVQEQRFEDAAVLRDKIKEIGEAQQ
ncbi:MAG: UvrB/UvrC motif-containing protein [Eubacterium sp.]|nr:UvrB/UvrC motif-containing protein [Eubacterium sp.]